MKDAILAAAMQIANLKGYKRVTRSDIATRAEIATGSVSYHYGSMKKLQAAMVERAVETENLKMLGQALSDRHPVALKAPESLRRAAAILLAG
jgi:AcrR family transcriptional regulator